MKNQSARTIVTLSNVGYVAACIVLYLIAICILVSSVISIIQDMTSGDYTVYKLLDEVGLIVFSMAVIDVGKYLMVEEVMQRKRDDNPHRTRKTLTKFAIIIASALALEGLVLTIEVAKQDISNLLYPVSILLTATAFIIGIGVYQLLNSRAEGKSSQ
ncbi:MAG: hypothetical protein KDK60_02790 [Chlamydiia bacterium]|nr:hypothetical protein [Chlamydiia bacterium]